MDVLHFFLFLPAIRKTLKVAQRRTNCRTATNGEENLKPKHAQKIGIRFHRGAYPPAVLPLHVEVVCRVDAFLHASPVPGHPALDRHVPGSRAQGELLQILHRDRRRTLKWEKKRETGCGPVRRRGKSCVLALNKSLTIGVI